MAKPEDKMFNQEIVTVLKVYYYLSHDSWYIYISNTKCIIYYERGGIIRFTVCPIIFGIFAYTFQTLNVSNIMRLLCHNIW